MKSRTVMKPIMRGTIAKDWNMQKKSSVPAWMKFQIVENAAGESGIKKELRTERKITTGFQ